MSDQQQQEGTQHTNEKKPFRVELHCELPPYELVNTPSVQQGLAQPTETSLRVWGCQFIQNVGMLLQCPQVVMASAQILFQRFFCRKSFIHNRVEIVAMACVFLAAKVEESVRRARDVVIVGRHVISMMSRDGRAAARIDTAGTEFLDLKGDILNAERRVLKELGFCVHVNHPHKLIVSYLKVLGLDQTEGLAQLAWNYMNDGLQANIFLRFTAEKIACSCIYLGLLKQQINVPAWWEAFGASLPEIQEIGATILALYTRPKVFLEDLLDEIDELKGIKKTPAVTPYTSTRITVASPPRDTDASQSNDGRDRGRDKSDQRRRESPRRRSPKSRDERSRKRSESPRRSSRRSRSNSPSRYRQTSRGGRSRSPRRSRSPARNRDDRRSSPSKSSSRNRR